MKKLCLLLIFCILTLTGCSCCNNRSFIQNLVNANYINESWLYQVNTNPKCWLVGADPWFLTGEPNAIETFALRAPCRLAMTSMSIRAREFNSIRIDGAYQVQIVGHQDRNRVNIIGPNKAARQLAVDVIGNTLYIHQAQDCKIPLNTIIVRIGIKNLRNLVVNGCADVYGRDILSDQLNIVTNNNGRIILAGNINLTNLTQLGRGPVTILDAYTPVLDIKDMGCGNINIAGRVGIRRISHCGNGTINIIGADSDGLDIFATNRAVINIAGNVNLRRVTACKCAIVNVYCVNSCGTYVSAQDNSRVGLSGTTQNLNVDLMNSTLFQGKFLRGGNVYARTGNCAHANVTADKKIFACAMDSSSIYFFGSPSIVSRYTAHHGTVVPVWNEMTASPCCFLPGYC